MICSKFGNFVITLIYLQTSFILTVIFDLCCNVIHLTLNITFYILHPFLHVHPSFCNPKMQIFNLFNNLLNTVTITVFVFVHCN